MAKHNPDDLALTTGVAAVFVRGYLQAFLDGETWLKPAVQRGLDLVHENDGQISMAYVSKLTRRAHESGYLEKYKHGKGYKIRSIIESPKGVDADDDNSNDFSQDSSVKIKTLLDSSFGLSVDPDILARSRALDLIEEKNITAFRLSKARKIPAYLFKLLMQRFNGGQYHMILVEHDSRVTVNGKNLSLVDPNMFDE